MPGKNLRLLSLDGGGVRGLSSLYILKLLMEKINPEAPPKPCNFFDMIGGTSTGGLIAIMLGRLKMSVDECIAAYGELSEEVFVKQQHRLNSKGDVQGRFDTAALEKAVRKCVRDANLPEDALLRDQDAIQCKTFVVATSSETAQNTQFTSYVSRDGDSDLLKTTQIWQAARATSAASSFFAPINIGPNKEEFVDGAVGANNPVEVLWDEARELWSQDRLEDNVRCIVSIGTGEPTLSAFGNKFWEIAKTLKEVATETERTANAFQNRHFDLVQANRYYRFNVKHGLENVGLEEWAQRDKIVAVTRHYLRTGVQRDFHNFKAVNTEPSPTAPQNPQLQIPPTAAPQRSSSESPARSAFSVLDASPRYINRGPDSNWRRLTEAALAVYETIYDSSKDPDGTVSLSSFQMQFHPTALRDSIVPTFWALLAPTHGPLSRNLTLALTYMVHMRWSTAWTPPPLSERRRAILERYGNWIECACGCGCKWTFGNDVGLRRYVNARRECAAWDWLRVGEVGRRVRRKGGRFYEDNRVLWKQTRGSS